MNDEEALGILWPFGAHLDAAGRLWVGGCSATELAAEHGTPLYVLCEHTLRRQMRAYRSALRHAYPAGGGVAYAAKAYLNLALAQLVAREGLHLDVVSGGELYVALRAGFPAEAIHFHGNNKSAAELGQALDAGVGRIVVDNFHELDLLGQLARDRPSAPVAVWLRLSPGLTARTHSHIQTGHDDSKFGFSIAGGDADRAVAAVLRLPFLNLVGLHAHIGSQILQPEILAENARRLVEFAAAMRDRHGFALRELSPGGGWGVPMTEGDAPAPIETYVQVIAHSAARACQEAGLDLPCLVLEPGRSIVARAGVALYRIGARKEFPGVRTYVAVDGGMADNIRPALYGARYSALAILGAAAGNPSGPEAAPAPAETVTIAGKFCESGDVLIRDVELPRLRPGDLLAVPMAGAYTVAMASNYNLAPRPAVVLVNDGQAQLMQRRETYSDLVARDRPLDGAPALPARRGPARVPGQFEMAAARPFRKYQALGNDYVVLDPADWPQEPSPEFVARVCRRHRGIGADGVLWGPITPGEPFSLKLFNPDGTQFEQSGNGLRIFARYVWDRGLPGGPRFVLNPPAGPVAVDVLDGAGDSIALDLGRISFDSRRIPMAGPAREVIREPMALDDLEIMITGVNIGNPHCVVFADDLAVAGLVGPGSPDDRLATLARKLGPILEKHALFPNRTNVQIVEVVDRHGLRVAVWERGAGYTLASGTSACAAAGAAVRLDRCDSPVTVQMPGGDAEVEIAVDWSARLTGAVTLVFAGEIGASF
jgi:diaminopimelate decarboxylase